MASLQEVAEGLRKGLAFEHIIDDEGGKEYVIPLGGREFHHIVAGNANGGYGGAADLTLTVFDNGHWHQDEWERCSRHDTRKSS
jgi:hypothetical protein